MNTTNEAEVVNRARNCNQTCLLIRVRTHFTRSLVLGTYRSQQWQWKRRQSNKRNVRPITFLLPHSKPLFSSPTPPLPCAFVWTIPPSPNLYSWTLPPGSNCYPWGSGYQNLTAHLISLPTINSLGILLLLHTLQLHTNVSSNEEVMDQNKRRLGDANEGQSCY